MVHLYVIERWDYCDDYPAGVCSVLDTGYTQKENADAAAAKMQAEEEEMYKNNEELYEYGEPSCFRVKEIKVL